MAWFFCNGFCHHPHLSFVICHFSQAYQKKKKERNPIGKFDFSFFFLFGVRGVCPKTHTPLPENLRMTLWNNHFAFFSFVEYRLQQKGKFIITPFFFLSFFIFPF